MSDSDIEIDEEPKPVKQKSATPLWMGIVVIVAFVCITTTLILQFMEYKYLRGAPLIEKDNYATQMLFPKK